MSKYIKVDAASSHVWRGYAGEQRDEVVNILIMLYPKNFWYEKRHKILDQVDIMIIFNVVTKNLCKFCKIKFLGRGYNATLTNQKQLLQRRKRWLECTLITHNSFFIKTYVFDWCCNISLIWIIMHVLQMITNSIIFFK